VAREGEKAHRHGARHAAKVSCGTGLVDHVSFCEEKLLVVWKGLLRPGEATDVRKFGLLRQLAGNYTCANETYTLTPLTRDSEDSPAAMLQRVHRQHLMQKQLVARGTLEKTRLRA
jgi:hypothetical protein